MKLSGAVWKFGDGLPATYFLSGRYDGLIRARQFEQLVPHLLEDIDPMFAERVRNGDVLVVGQAFGTGKHLEGLVEALKLGGIGAVIARSFSAGWERDSTNRGLPAVTCSGLFDRVQSGERLELDLATGEAANFSTGVRFKVEPMPAGMLQILQAGGLEPFTLNQLRQAAPRRATFVRRHPCRSD